MLNEILYNVDSVIEVKAVWLKAPNASIQFAFKKGEAATVFQM
jgi:hypothetical protein